MSRLQLTAPDALLARVGGDLGAGSRVAAVKVGDIQAIGFEVRLEPRPDDPGHAGIYATERATFDEREAVRQLAAAFRYLGTTPRTPLLPHNDQGHSESVLGGQNGW